MTKKIPMGDTGFVRDEHDGKGRFDLLPWGAIWELAKHCEEGATHYGERNIDLGAPQHSLIDSAIRHLAKYLMGWTDEKHLRAALWNVAWAVEQDTYRPELIDIPNVMRQKESKQCVETSCFYNDNLKCSHGTADPLNCEHYSED